MQEKNMGHMSHMALTVKVITSYIKDTFSESINAIMYVTIPSRMHQILIRFLGSMPPDQPSNARHIASHKRDVLQHLLFSQNYTPQV